MTKEILDNPFENGRKLHKIGYSIHANPFRNYEGYPAEFIEWKNGWKSYSDTSI